MVGSFTGKIEKTPDDLVREAMHELPYGIYVIGSVRDGRPNGMIADWVMQISFEPRLIAVGLERDSTTLANLRERPVMTVNLLAEDGMPLAQGFLQPTEASKIAGRGDDAASQRHDKLAGVDYSVTESGCPILDAALAFLDCEVERFIDIGDHTLAIARVVDGEVLNSAEPLTSTITGWSYSG